MTTEQSHHDDFYAAESDFFQSPIFQQVHGREAEFVRSRTPADAHAVSLGCGEGGIELKLASHVRDVIGIDLSQAAVDLAAKQAHEAGVTNVEFRQGDVLAIEIPDRSVDVVWALAFLHHLPPEALAPILARVRQWLRPGGILITIDPSERRAVRHLARFVRGSYDKHHSPDERELDPREIAATVTGAGFRDVQTIWTDFAAGPLAWLAPSIPPWAARAAVAVDTGALHIPGVRQLSSSFSITAVA